MTINEKHKCDIGGEIYDKREQIRNDVAIINGEHSRTYDVCDRHIGVIVELLDKEFPKNKYIKSE